MEKIIREITLTLAEAAMYYKEGGKSKDLVLKIYSEKEITNYIIAKCLPKSWEEYYDSLCKDLRTLIDLQLTESSILPHKYIALRKLEILRDVYRMGWKQDKYEGAYCIYRASLIPTYLRGYYRHFLSFQDRSIASAFKDNFLELIKEADDLI